jgi:hypothetical protein
MFTRAVAQKAVMRDIERNPNTFPKYIKRAARMLSAAYA